MTISTSTLSSIASSCSPVCDLCGKPLRTTRVEVPSGDGVRAFEAPVYGSCGCAASRRRMARLDGRAPKEPSTLAARAAGLPARFGEGDETPDVERLADAVLSGSWLYVYGPLGTGKSRLSASVGHALVRRGKHGVRFIRAADLLEQEVNGESRYEEACSCGYLVLDDLGKEHPSDWAASVLFGVVDARYSSCLPTVITSNYAPPDLLRLYRGNAQMEAVVSRLTEVCRMRSTSGADMRRSRKGNAAR
jgi:predicted ATPase